MQLARRLLLLAVILILPTQTAFGATTTTLIGTPIQDTSDQSTYTFTNVDIGAEDPDRCVKVAFESRKGAAAVTTITSATIGGSAATILRQAQIGSVSTNLVGIFARAVPTGTTATIAVTLDQTMSRSEIVVYRSIGSACTTASDTDSDTAILDPSVNLDVPAGGVAIGSCAAGSGGSARTATWTGLTERYEVGNLDGAMSATGGMDDFATVQTGLTMTCTFSGSDGTATGIGVFVSWAPSGAGGGGPPIGSLQMMGVGR